MNHLYGGTFFSHDRISVISDQGSGLDLIPVKRPKMIVGISITPPSIRTFDPSAWVFPAILDTGCNQGFEIDERHLYLWNSTRKRHFPVVRRHQPVLTGDRGYDYMMANIWLHLEPYTGPKFRGPKLPYHLMGTDEMVVMDDTTLDPDPRFPLLGLKALRDNNLILRVDAYINHFDIHEA